MITAFIPIKTRFFITQAWITQLCPIVTSSPIIVGKPASFNFPFSSNSLCQT
ncbi:hypothetical protein cje79_06049 [Campylobacter jejuni subsp. jejuni 1893]|nr:hypothetical protein cje79_06049 [Campylobacter jejuni subsp. jejuni 1893]